MGLDYPEGNGQAVFGGLLCVPPTFKPAHYIDKVTFETSHDKLACQAMICIAQECVTCQPLFDAAVFTFGVNSMSKFDSGRVEGSSNAPHMFTKARLPSGNEPGPFESDERSLVSPATHSELVTSPANNPSMSRTNSITSLDLQDFVDKYTRHDGMPDSPDMHTNTTASNANTTVTAAPLAPGIFAPVSTNVSDFGAATT